MELKQLRYFCAVAETEHFSRAAEGLRLAQPALSQQIRALERELGVQLFRRLGRGVELTEAGRIFWRECESIFQRVGAATLLAQETDRGESGRIAIGLTDTATFAAQVMHVLKAAQDRWPRVQFSFIHSVSADLYNAVAEHRVDIAFTRSPMINDANLKSLVFLSEHYFAAMPSKHPLAGRRSISITDLADQPLILPVARNDQRGANLMQVLGATGQQLRIVQETPEYVTALNLAIAGFGIAVVPQALTNLRSDAITYRKIVANPQISTDILLVWRANEISAAGRNIVNFVRNFTLPAERLQLSC